MKKILYILSIALLAALSCNKEFDRPMHRTQDKTPEGSMLLTFSVPMSPSTKDAMNDKPNITPTSKMYVLVFNASSRTLLQVSPAVLKGSINENTPWDADDENDIYNADFAAEVGMGSAPRYLQFVVDAPDHTPASGNDNETMLGTADLPVYVGDSEADVAEKLFTSSGVTAFWQRIYLQHGLQAYTYPGGKPKYGTEGTDWTYSADQTPADSTDDYYVDKNLNTVYYGDFVNGSNHKITDGTGYIMSSEVAKLVKHIPLVRNFLKIKVYQADGGSFVPSKAILVNVPKSGFVSPYNHSANGFVNSYLFKGGLQTLPAGGPAGVQATGYTAPIPGNEIVPFLNWTIPAQPTASDWETAEALCTTAVDDTVSLYMYERGKAESSPTQLLACGTLNGVANRWLKIDITDEHGKYLAFYRDFTYEMKIGNIVGSTGYDSMQEAYEGPSIGNPSASPETKNLTQISDNKGLFMWVDYIDHASFDPDGETVRLRFKFWRKGTNGSITNLTESVTLKVTHGTSPGAVTVDTLTKSEYTGTNNQGNPDTQDGTSGWFYVDVPLRAQGSSIVRSVVEVSGTADNNSNVEVTLFRDVRFSVMPKQPLTLSMSTLAEDAIAQPAKLTITLPNTLGYSLFPLVLRIEAYNGSLNPTDTDLAVAHGKSTFSTLENDDPNAGLRRSSNFFWFEKIIDFEDYDRGIYTYEANFNTILQSGNPTVVAVSDPDGHFKTATIALTD